MDAVVTVSGSNGTDPLIPRPLLVTTALARAAPLVVQGRVTAAELLDAAAMCNLASFFIFCLR